MIIVTFDTRILLVGDRIVSTSPLTVSYRDKLDNEYLMAYAFEVDYHEVTEAPNDVEPEKYCYTPEEGFYLNPNYQEPNKYNIPDEIYNQIIDDYTLSLIEEGVL